MTVIEYIKAKVGFELTDNNIQVILVDRGFTANADIATLSLKDKELLYADALMVGFTSPSKAKSETIKDNAFEHSVSGATMGDNKRLYSLAMAIYSKYGEFPNLSNVVSFQDIVDVE